MELFIQSRWCKQSKLHKKCCWSFFPFLFVCHCLSVPSVSCYFIQLYKCNVKITSNGMCTKQLLIGACHGCTSLDFDAKLHFLNDFIYFLLELLQFFPALLLVSIEDALCCRVVMRWVICKQNICKWINIWMKFISAME